MNATDRRILRLALPALGSLAVEPLYILVDTAIVGHLGTPQLGGLGVASSILLTGYTDPDDIIAAINQVLAGNPTADLLDIEMVFRAAAGASYLVADGAGSRVVIGMQAWVAEIDRLGRTPEQNRQALADVRLHRER